MKFFMAVVAALSLLTGTARAAEVAGVKFDEHLKLEQQELSLNGAGLRSKVFFKVYAVGLYLPAKAGDVEGVLAAKGAKRLAIVPLMELTAQQFVDALSGGIAKNHSEAEAAALQERIQTFEANLLALGKATKGTPITLDWIPEQGTRLTVAGQPQGKIIPGEDFYRALLRIWLGNKPAQGDLKEALLGKAQ
ncbi:MAG TPA: chalcone isomerase family protein [Azospira sp.]|nr:chalcone isomerase family protein [Azospira sp.]